MFSDDNLVWNRSLTEQLEVSNETHVHWPVLYVDNDVYYVRKWWSYLTEQERWTFIKTCATDLRRRWERGVAGIIPKPHRIWTGVSLMFIIQHLYRATRMSPCRWRVPHQCHSIQWNINSGWGQSVRTHTYSPCLPERPCSRTPCVIDRTLGPCIDRKVKSANHHYVHLMNCKNELAVYDKGKNPLRVRYMFVYNSNEGGLLNLLWRVERHDDGSP